MEFLHADLAWWLTVAAVGTLLARWCWRRRFAASTTVLWISRDSHAAAVRRLPLLLIGTALACVDVALMDPTLPHAETAITSRGLDIAIVLDLSSSMQEDMERPRRIADVQDFRSTSGAARVTNRHPNQMRLEAVKNAVRQFISYRRGDRIGLIVFSEHAYVISPLTMDYEYLLHYVEMVNNEILSGEGMTAIGDGLALANYLLDRQSRAAHGNRGRVIILFTDGENNRGRDPIDVLAESDAAGIRVHMVGVDLEEELRKKASVQLLVDNVRRNGGRYFNANTMRDLAVASSTIDSLEKGSLVSKRYDRYQPVFHWFAIAAMLLLLTAASLGAIPYFIDQT